MFIILGGIFMLKKFLKKTVALTILSVCMSIPIIYSFSSNCIEAQAWSYGNKTHGTVKTNDKDGVNVRNEKGEIIGALPDGTEVVIASREGSKFHIISPIEGLVVAKYIEVYNYND